MKKFIANYIEDILIFSGLVVITVATFLLSTIVGLYVLGVFLVLLGCYLTKYPIGGDK